MVLDDQDTQVFTFGAVVDAVGEVLHQEASHTIFNHSPATGSLLDFHDGSIEFTQEGIAHLCEESGLTPVTLLAQGGSILTLCQVLNFLAYGVFGRGGAPLYATLNVAAAVGDRLVPNELFCHNFACLARRACGWG